MGKLHEVLAVEPEVKAAAEAILNETINVFSKKHDHFIGLSKSYTPRNEEGERFPAENKEMVTTVRAKLKHTEKALIRLLDLTYQKEAANTSAKADLVLGGTIVAKDVPATVLLNLENRLKHLKKMYMEIPTLDPGEQWIPDTQREDTFVLRAPKISFKTHKVTKPLLLSPATDKHPAQVDKITVDETIGQWEAMFYNGKLPPVEKSQLLERLDSLISATKRARCRANEVEVPNVKLAEALFSYINTGAVAQAAQ